MFTDAAKGMGFYWLKGLKLLECLMTIITIMNRAAKGWPEGILQISIYAIAPWTGSMFQNIDISKQVFAGWGRC